MASPSAKPQKTTRDPKVFRSVVAFWCLGLLNNFLYVVMNAGASKINDSGIGLVYLANVVPSLLVKLTGPYWFHLVPYKVRVWISAVLMTLCLLIVAWADSGKVKLLGVSLASFQGGIGEASMLAMASFYDSQMCLAGWSSGTGFAGIFGYFWSILFSQAIGACFQLELMVGLWIPIAWLLTFHLLLDEPWIDQARAAAAEEDGSNPASDASGGESSDSASEGAASAEEGASSEEGASRAKVHHETPVTARLTCTQRLRFTLSLWPYMIPLFLVYASEYIIQAGVWASMGFPATDPVSRHQWYQWSNFTYQVGVFISRSLGGLRVFSVPVLWAGPTLQVVMLAFFYCVAVVPFGGWWLIAPALLVGFLGGFVYVQAFVLISQKVDEKYVELALSTASVADSFGIILADIVAIVVQGCLFGQLGITDTRPDFTCGYDIWEEPLAVLATNATRAATAAVCFPGVSG